MFTETKENLYREILNKVLDADPVFNEKTAARIDIEFKGKGSPDLQWLLISDPSSSLKKPEWFNKTACGYTLTSDKGRIALKFKCVGSGNLEIALRGIDKKNKNLKRIPLWIDFTGMQINGKYIFNEKKEIWHDHPFKYQIQVKNNDQIYIIATWEEHRENGNK